MRRICCSRVDECLKRPKLFAVSILDSTNFSDHVGIATPAGGLEIKNTKCDFVKGRAEIVERLLEHVYESSEQMFDRCAVLIWRVRDLSATPYTSQQAPRARLGR